jgi:hypothetical protein
MFVPYVSQIQPGRSATFQPAPAGPERVQQVVPLAAQLSLANLAVDDPYDVWLFTPERSSIDRATIVGDSENTFDPVTVQFIQKNASEVIELTETQTFESLSPTEPFELNVPSDLPELPLFLRFQGPEAPIDAFVTLYTISNNTQ